jgi:hypothetical protein
MTHGKPHRRDYTRQRPRAVARVPERAPMNAAAALLLGLIIVILVLGKSGVMV